MPTAGKEVSDDGDSEEDDNLLRQGPPQGSACGVPGILHHGIIVPERPSPKCLPSALAVSRVAR